MTETTPYIRPEATLKTVRDRLAAESEQVIDTVASLMLALGAKTEWSMDDNFQTTEAIAALADTVGLPSAGDQSEDDLKFWGTIALHQGYDTDYEPDEDQDAELDPSTWAYLMQQEVRANYQRPWPIAVDAEMVVVSGLGEDDGARLIGFQSPGVQNVILMASEWITDTSKAVGLEPVFSNGNLFVMQGAVESVAHR